MSAAPAPPGALGTPRLHFRRTDSTNTRARELAAAGAPHGMLVTATEQTAGRGRQGRTWTAPAARALLCSLIVRSPPPLLSLRAGVAVAQAVGRGALVKWPNDVLIDARKVAGVLVEGRPQEDWSVLGIGVNVAVREAELTGELAARAGTLGLGLDAVEPVLSRLLSELERWLAATPAAVLDAVRARDALLGAPVSWSGGSGRGAGLDADGRLLVSSDQGVEALSAGEVHLVPWNRSRTPADSPQARARRGRRDADLKW
jgi:BirA family biotin operon repressor/biotin-[acetyl-CoA-carboxylase] ligase